MSCSTCQHGTMCHHPTHRHTTQAYHALSLAHSQPSPHHPTHSNQHSTHPTSSASSGWPLWICPPSFALESPARGEAVTVDASAGMCKRAGSILRARSMISLRSPVCATYRSTCSRGRASATHSPNHDASGSRIARHSAADSTMVRLVVGFGTSCLAVRNSAKAPMMSWSYSWSGR